MPKMVFLNISWMKDYQGIKNDKPKGGGQFVEKYGYGHEIFNFKPYRGYLYGYVKPSRTKINISNLGASESDESIDNILVIWVARRPGGGSCIVGWYNNATVYRDWQYLPRSYNRIYKGEDVSYNVMSKADKYNFELLPIDRRIFSIPRSRNGKGNMGNSNVWYADNDNKRDFKKDVFTYVRNHGFMNRTDNRVKSSKQIQKDFEKRKKIEKVAINKTKEYYENIGYDVKSVEPLKKGWDLEAVSNSNTLKLEVKGLSQKNISVELTPNEYKKMQKHRKNYVICVVTNALGNKPKLTIFDYSPEHYAWENEHGEKLNIEIMESARMYL